MNIRYRVTLSAEERESLLKMVQGGKGAVRRLKRAQILLASDLRATDEEIARNVSVGTSTVYRTKQRFVEEGLEAALGEASRPGAPRKLDVEDEAILCALSCSKPPSGRARWSLQLLANEMVRLEVTFRRALGRAKLPRIRVHDLRHVFASHFVMGGGDIFTLQRILGHSTPQLTSDTYAHLSPRHLAGEADRIAYPEPAEPATVLPFAMGAADEAVRVTSAG